MDKSIVVFNRNSSVMCGGKSVKRKSKTRKTTKAESTNEKGLQTTFDNLVPEKYSYGKCGPKFGFCNGNRYCNKDGECGEEKSHKQQTNNENYKYRLCVGMDKECVKKAVCSADKSSEIKCRLVF